MSIGSSRWADLVVSDNELSSLHIQLALAADECWLRDLKSSKGTYVNGTRITATEICDGDIVRFGQNTIRIDLLDDLNARRNKTSSADIIALSHWFKEQLPVTTLPNGHLRFSLGRVSIQELQSLIESCLPCGLMLVTSNEAIGRNWTQIQRSRNELSIQKYVAVCQENRDQLLRDFWGRQDVAWLVGRPSASALEWLSLNPYPFDLIQDFPDRLEAIQTSWFTEMVSHFQGFIYTGKSPSVAWNLFLVNESTRLPKGSKPDDRQKSSKGLLSSVA